MASIGNQMESARFIEFEGPGVVVGLFEAFAAEEAEGPAVDGFGGVEGGRSRTDGPARGGRGEVGEIARRAEDEGEGAALGGGELEAAGGGHVQERPIADDDIEAAAAEGDIQGPGAFTEVGDIHEDGAGQKIGAEGEGVGPAAAANPDDRAISAAGEVDHDGEGREPGREVLGLRCRRGDLEQPEPLVDDSSRESFLAPFPPFRERLIDLGPSGRVSAGGPRTRRRTCLLDRAGEFLDGGGGRHGSTSRTVSWRYLLG
jgi:hypothetical protein